MKPLISATEFRQLTGNPIIIDARTGPDAYERYLAGHLPGALPVDLEKDLSSKKENAANGGRHPLPEIDAFAEWMARNGITPTSHVIVYDDKSGANAASRCWWTLRAAGHQKVQVLDGGMQAAVREGVQTVTAATHPLPAGKYPVTEWQLPTTTIDFVETVADKEDFLVIDVREAYRYNGESEPFDLVAGHIPGAVNIPYPGNLKEDGTFLTPEDLAAKYKAAIGDRSMNNVIVHCGSGVTACHTLLALEQAGLQNATLYVGSWSEWSRNDKPIATNKK